MTAGKTDARTFLDDVGDAFFENILECSEAELRAEFEEMGRSPDEAVLQMKERLAAARDECAQARLADARNGLTTFRQEGAVVPLDLARQRERLAAMRTRAPSAAGMMMAARKGEGLSERDEAGLLGDLADLERLSGKPDGGGRE